MASALEGMETPTVPDANHHQVAARGFGQTFGLHPAIAALAVTVDLMLHAAEVERGKSGVPESIRGHGNAHSARCESLQRNLALGTRRGNLGTPARWGLPNRKATERKTHT